MFKTPLERGRSQLVNRNIELKSSKNVCNVQTQIQNLDLVLDIGDWW